MIPKFRAWLKNHEKMVEVLEIDFEGEQIIYSDINEYGAYGIELKHVELFQSIDHKDKNGEEIYRKDILKATMVIGKNLDLDRRRNVDLSTVYFEVDYIQSAFLISGLNIHKTILVNSLFMDNDYYKERIKGSAHFKVESEEDVYYRFDDFERVGTSYENPELLKGE